ncbi:hypothetical protein LWI29_004389 [Acer saccharum]|uniref:Uncharacterized protein n=1 Tax=Acer saccharum TaxID=4024 RepID=A0AA39VQS9_ACESA|nr:hypothetical protein LWI29_004389 [Acer saccharum]
MVSLSMHGFVEDPKVLDATLCSTSHTSVPICGGGSVSSSGGLRLGNVLPSTPASCDIPVSVGGPSSTVVGLIPIPLPDVPIVQQVCSLLPREASPPPSIVVSSGGPIMESLSSSLPHEVSPPPHVVVSSSGPIMESFSSGGPSQSVEQIFQSHGISSSRFMQSESSLIDSHVELGFVAVAP